MRRRLSPAALPLHRHSLAQLALDGLLVVAAWWLAYRLRFDQAAVGVPSRYADLRDTMLPWVGLTAIVVFIVLRLEQKQWRYATQRDYAVMVQAVTLVTLVVAAAVALARPVLDVRHGDNAVTVPTGVVALFFLLMLLFVGGARFLARIIYERPVNGFRARKDARRVLIVGAGDGGRLVLREILKNPMLALRPVGFVDDDPLKRGVRVDGVKVLGTTSQLSQIGRAHV